MVMAEKIDKRILQTKIAVKKAFVELLDQKPIEKITVKEICSKAGITRGTFYAHYENEYDLLKSLILEMTNNSFDLIENVPDPDLSYEEKIGMLTDMFDYLKDNKQLLKMLVTRGAYIEISDRASDYFRRLCLIKSEDADTDQIKAAYYFTGYGILGLLGFWLNENETISSRKLAVFFKSIVDGGLREFVETSN